MKPVVSRRAILRITGTAAAFAAAPLGKLESAASAAAAAAVETQRSATGVDSAAALFYRDDWLGEPWRTPETVLMIHGVYESSIAWYGWVPRMAQQFRVLRPDLPGSGQSRIPDGFEWSLTSLTGTLARLLDRIGVASTHVIGAKFGGSIAMQFAADYPQRTRTLSVVSGPVSRPSISSTPSTPQGARLGSEAPKEQVDYWNAMMASANREASQGAGRVLQSMNLDPILPRITAPTLVITSDRSPLQPVEAVMRYQQKIPNSRLLVLSSDAYHVAVVKAEECVTGVLSFIHETRA